MIRLRGLVLVPVLTLAACDGPAEKVGREQDKAAAVAAGQAYSGDGPRERLGEAQDRAEDAARDARAAQANSLHKTAVGMKAEADLQADRFEQQAKTIREQAKAQAAPLERKADTIREAK